MFGVYIPKDELLKEININGLPECQSPNIIK